MKKPILAVDFDDVVADFNQAFITYHNNYHGTNMRYEDLASHDMSKTYGTDVQTMELRVIDFYYNHHDTIKPFTDAVAGLLELKKRYRLEVVTARCESLTGITFGWTTHHIPKLFDEIHYANGYASKFPERKRSKLEICDKIGAIAFIDDAVSHVNQVAAGLGIHVFLPNRPWNQAEEIIVGVNRVHTWNEITKRLLS
jgi:5'(3')-deoxyribonucleotidase